MYEQNWNACSVHSAHVRRLGRSDELPHIFHNLKMLLGTRASSSVLLQRAWRKVTSWLINSDFVVLIELPIWLFCDRESARASARAPDWGTSAMEADSGLAVTSYNTLVTSYSRPSSSTTYSIFLLLVYQLSLSRDSKDIGAPHPHTYTYNRTPCRSKHGLRKSLGCASLSCREA
jgi:hypothetical protein